MSRPLAERIGERLRRLRALPRARAVILVYHRVAELRSDPWGLAVPPAVFEDHLRLIRQEWQPLALRELVGAVQERRVPHGGVAVTFDDGYADNLHAARPLLERYDVPATVFLVSGALGDSRIFWWDELARIILGAATLPSTLALGIGGQQFRWELPPAGGSAADGYRADPTWRAWNVPKDPRQALYGALWERLRGVPATSRTAALDRLEIWAGASGAPPDADRALRADELGALVAGDLVAVGAHTARHPRLSELTPEEQRVEIFSGRLALQEQLGRPVVEFAYPFGGREDYTARSVQIVRSAGFSAACSVAADSVGNGADLFQLPRLYVSGWSVEELAGALRTWLGRPRRSTRATGR